MLGRTELLLAAGAGAATAWSLPAPAAHIPLLARSLGIPYRVDPRKGIALTFDDGPHPEGTPALLDRLDSANARATFFVVGEQLERYPELGAEIVERGHEVALHGFRHRLLLRRTPAALARDLDRGAALIASITGRIPVFYRPPYGVFSTAGLALARNRGWKPMLWSRWGWDWAANRSAASIALHCTTGLRAGDVLLLHDADHYSSSGSWRRTLAALPTILEAIASLDRSALTLSESM